MGRTVYTFRFQNERFGLISYERTEVRRNTGEIEAVRVDFPAGRMKTVRSDIETDGPGAVSWTAVPRRPLLTIDEVGNGLEFLPPSG